MKTLTEYAFLEQFLFGGGDYEVVQIPEKDNEAPRPLLVLRAKRDDEADVRHVPQVDLSALQGETASDPIRRRVMSALVRAGARHPGIDDLDLRALHRISRQEGHIELFCDLNALSTGLVKQLVESLGRRCCRVVVSSSSIDILHEYQGPGQKDFLSRAEMNRCLSTLEELRAEVAVHVHPLPPGATFYMRRPAAEPIDDDSGPVVTYISEDRQMIAAFWHYLSVSNPRVPVRLVTSDFSLARVCSAERVPFLFARHPYEIWWREQIAIGQPATPELYWFDPFALTFRAASMHRLLWELALVFRRLHVKVRAQGSAGSKSGETDEVVVRSDFALFFDSRKHLPGRIPQVSIGTPAELLLQTKTSKPATTVLPVRRKLKLSLTSVLHVMPTRVGQSVARASFKPTDDDSLRMLVHVGQATELFTVSDKWIIGSKGLDALLAALEQRDYIAVNTIFRRIAAYDEVLNDAASGAPFPSSKVAGAATGWAVVLGAAYKTPSHGTLFGLADVTEERFERAVVRAHAEIGKGQRSIPLPPIIDRVCRSVQISPIRFEVLLDATIGKRGLSDFEAQRATAIHRTKTSRGSISSKHPVLTAPTTAASDSYLRSLDPESGLVIGTKLVGALVCGRGPQA